MKAVLFEGVGRLNITDVPEPVPGANDVVIEAAAVADGKMAYSVLQPIVTLAEMAVQQAHSYLTTGSTGVGEEKQSVDCFLINPDNVGTYTFWALEG